MFCVQCGFKIEDGFNFCPNCGTKAIFAQSEPEHRVVKPEKNLVGGYEYCPNNVQQSKEEISRVEIDMIADEIVSWCPSQVRGIKVFRDRTGLDLKTAKTIMEEKYRLKSAISFQNDVCPKCGSMDIVYEKEPDRSTTVSYFEGVYNTTFRPGKTIAKCKNCKKKWKF